jgi:HEPN domain-containing protein
MAPRRGSTTRPTSLVDARAYLSKALEFLEAASDSLEHGNFVACSGNAVHAGIAAADAVSSVRSGSVWTGEHAQAALHVQKVGGADGQAIARQLRRLLPLKNRAEYDPAPISATDARNAYTAAERSVTIAKKVLGGRSEPR